MTKIAYSTITCPVPAELPPGEHKVNKDTSPNNPPQRRTDNNDDANAPPYQSVKGDADGSISNEQLCKWLIEAREAGIGFIYYDANQSHKERGLMIIANGLDSSILRVLLDEEKLSNP